MDNRINIQLIDNKTNEQVWSKVFDRKLTSVNMFEIQDDIIGQIILEFKNFSKSVLLALAGAPEKIAPVPRIASIDDSVTTFKKTNGKSISA